MWLHHYKEYSNQDIAELLYIHVATVRRIITQFNTYGDVSPASYKHGPNRMLGQQDEETIIELLMDNPAMYLDELQQAKVRVPGPVLVQFFVLSVVLDSLEKC